MNCLLDALVCQEMFNLRLCPSRFFRFTLVLSMSCSPSSFIAPLLYTLIAV